MPHVRSDWTSKHNVITTLVSLQLTPRFRRRASEQQQCKNWVEIQCPSHMVFYVGWRTISILLPFPMEMFSPRAGDKRLLPPE